MHFINSEELEMKALNRAIARTISQIARYAGEGCHVPMIMAMENHLDALLTMERKMLEGVHDGQYWTPERVAVFNRWDASDKAQQAPDVVDMTDPRNWQAGDVVVRDLVYGEFDYFTPGMKYTVASNDHGRIKISGDHGKVVVYFYDQIESVKSSFTWLRHGEVQS